MKKIYLAGFDVFYPDAEQRGERMKKICKEYGFTGLFPLDKRVNGADEIYRANIRLIEQCDIVAANMNSFRGKEPDSGTAFEIGYATALGKKVYCYMDDTRSLREKIGELDENGLTVEDFDLPLNIMISVPCVIVRGIFSDCIKTIKDKK